MRTHEQIMAKIWAEIEEAEKRPWTAETKDAGTPGTGAFANWRSNEDESSEVGTLIRVEERHIHGIASTPRPVTSGKGNKIALQSSGVKARMPLPLLSGHAQGQPIGEVYYVRRTPRVVYVRARLFDTPAALYAWGLIESGEVSSLSVLAKEEDEYGAFASSVVDGYRFVSRWSMEELSLVRAPANPDCKLEVLSPNDDGWKFWGAPNGGDWKRWGAR